MNELQNNKYVIISKGLHTIRKEMSMDAKKVFYIAISKINLDNPKKTKYIEISRDEILDTLKLNLPTNRKTDYVTDILENMAKNAKYFLRQNGKFIYFPIFTKAYYDEMKLKLEFNDCALSTFQNLGSFITIYLKDMLEMSSTIESARAEELYLHFRVNSDTRKECSITLSDEQIRNILALPQDAYIQNGIFKRNDFEKWCLRPVLEKLTKTEHVTLIPYKSEKGTDLFEKIKIDYKKKGYKLRYKVNMNVLPKQSKNNANEIIPEKSNQKAPAPAKTFKKPNSFNEMMSNKGTENDYDFAEIEKAILANS